MFTLERCSPVGMDCTADYIVVLDRRCTVIEFILEVVNSRSDEWGDMYIKRVGEALGIP